MRLALRVCEIERSAGGCDLGGWRADREPKVSRKALQPNFDQTLETLKAHGFEVGPYSGPGGGTLVSKNGAAAVLTTAKDAAVALAVHPGMLVRGEVARLLDRGYQKFIKTSQYELPATATQLHSIHAFSAELKQLTGAVSLYNESLGTTSDEYEYDRLKGREVAEPTAARPWDAAGGH